MLTLRPCGMSPGVEIRITSGGEAIINQFVTSPTTIRRTLVFVTVSIPVSVSSSGTSLRVSVDTGNFVLLQ